MNGIKENYCPHGLISIYASVLLETTDENLFILLSDIHPLVEEGCKDYIKRIDQSKFELQVIFVVAPKRENNSSTCQFWKD